MQSEQPASKQIGHSDIALSAGSKWQQIDWSLTPDGAPAWIGWGAASGGAPSLQCAPLPAATLDADPRLDLCPVTGRGWMQHPALAGYRPSSSGNRDWAPHWNACQITRADNQIEVTLSDAAAGLVWRQTWSLIGDERLWCVRTFVQNTGCAAYQLSWLASVTLPVPARATRVLTLGGPWANEFKEHWDPLPAATFRRDNRRGRTSHDCFPGAMLGADDLGEESGAGWAVHLGFSGNHSLLIEPLSDGRRQLQIGELLQDGERLLAVGEIFAAPPAYVAASAAGLTGLSKAFHQGLRQQVLRWPDKSAKARPVHLNTWEAMYFQHEWNHLKGLAEAAAQAGVERFVLDDGWFHCRNHDRAGLGDWWPDTVKYPEGLTPLAQLLESLRLEFGLWVEPEMLNPDSDLYRSHPDWVLELPNAPSVLGRHQLVLNLTKPEVCEYLFTCLDRLLSRWPIRYLKWDMNRDLAPAAADGLAVHGEQVRALYRLLERVRAAHPKVEIETCASGGGRADFGILALTHRVWISDCNDALERIAIQRGFLRFFPPEIMGAHIGPAPAHTTGRHHRLSFRAAVALLGHLGVEMDLSSLNLAERQELAAWISLHKRLRPIIHGATVHHGATQDGVTSVAAWNTLRESGVLCVFRIAASMQRYTTPMLLPWLAAQPLIQVRACVPNDVNLPPGWEDWLDGRVFSGSSLAHHGLPLPPMRPESAWVLELNVLVSSAEQQKTN